MDKENTKVVYKGAGNFLAPLLFARPRTSHAAEIRDLYNLHKKLANHLCKITT